MRGRAAAVVLACLALPSPAAAQEAITNLQGLSFGRFVANAGGTVTISAAGLRSAAGAVLLLQSGGGAAARFQITGGQSNAQCNFSFPPGGEIILTGPGESSMVVNNFTSSLANPIQLNAAGGALLDFGATLHVGSNQAPGSYQGSFAISVNFN